MIYSVRQNSPLFADNKIIQGDRILTRLVAFGKLLNLPMLGFLHLSNVLIMELTTQWELVKQPNAETKRCLFSIG